VSDFYQASGQINGVLAMFNQIRYLPDSERAAGWMAMDDAQKRRVIVLGDGPRRTLFPGGPRWAVRFC